MKGKEIVPGQDPLLDKALAELRKGLRKGEDPFYVDLNARRTDPSDSNSTPPPEGQAVRGGSITHRLIVGVRRYGIQGALLIGAVIAVVLLGVYAIGFSKGRRARSVEGSQPDLQAPNATTQAVSPSVVGASGGPKSEPVGAAHEAAPAQVAPSSTPERMQADAPNRAPAPSARSAPIRRFTPQDRANSPPTSAPSPAAKPNGLPIQTLEN